METTIKLYVGYGIYEDKVILKDDSDLLINVEYNLLRDTYLVYQATNGKEKRTYKIENNHFILPNKFLLPGKIEITIDLVCNKQIIKRFKIEDLIIKELDKQIECIPQIEDLEEQVLEARKEIGQIKNQLNLFIKLWKEKV